MEICQICKRGMGIPKHNIKAVDEAGRCDCVKRLMDCFKVDRKTAKLMQFAVNNHNPYGS